MVTCENEEARYRVVISNGKHEISADTLEKFGGGESAIRPHELLEAALAACLNMTIRMYADKNDIPLTNIRTSVTADRSEPGRTKLIYSYSVEGTLTDEQRSDLARAAEKCPVRKTLSNAIEFVNGI